MLAGRLVRLIEKNSEKLARELSEKVWNSPRCSDLRKVPPDELQARTREIYQNLNNWLMDMTEARSSAAIRSWARAEPRKVSPIATSSGPSLPPEST